MPFGQLTRKILSICLALVLAGAGAALIFDYVSLRKRNLEPVTGEVIRVDGGLAI